MPPVSCVRLRIERRAIPCAHLEPSGSNAASHGVPLLRLAASVQIAQPNGSLVTKPERALIDTGAWLTAIEQETWQSYDQQGLIEHLPFAPDATPGSCSIGGRESPFRLGRLHIAVLDLQASGVNWLPAVPVTAMLLEDPAMRLTAPLLLGLHLGVLDGRKLTREPAPQLTTPIPQTRTTDCGEWFAQEWFLETP